MDIKDKHSLVWKKLTNFGIPKSNIIVGYIDVTIFGLFKFFFSFKGIVNGLQTRPLFLHRRQT